MTLRITNVFLVGDPYWPPRLTTCIEIDDVMVTLSTKLGSGVNPLDYLTYGDINELGDITSVMDNEHVYYYAPHRVSVNIVPNKELKNFLHEHFKGVGGRLVISIRRK